MMAFIEHGETLERHARARQADAEYAQRQPRNYHQEAGSDMKDVTPQKEVLKIEKTS